MGIPDGAYFGDGALAEHCRRAGTDVDEARRAIAQRARRDAMGSRRTGPLDDERPAPRTGEDRVAGVARQLGELRDELARLRAETIEALDATAHGGKDV